MFAFIPLFATTRKTIYAACLIQDFLVVEINNTKVHESSREFGGGAWAPLVFLYQSELCFYFAFI